MNNIIVLKGIDYENDKRVIEENIKSNPIFLLDNKQTRLWQYIDCIHDTYNLGNNTVNKLNICNQIRFGGNVTLNAEDGSEIGKPSSMEDLLKHLNPGTKYHIVVEDDDRNMLADIVQQLIYINYPLPQTDFKLKREYKDAAKTKRFMTKIPQLKEAAQTAVDIISKLVTEHPELNEKAQKDLRETKEKAFSAYKEINEQLKKAASHDIKIAISASKKTGKSVIVNCMLEAELAPTSLEMATPNTCIYRKSPDEKFHLEFYDKATKKSISKTDFNTAAEIYKRVTKEFKDALIDEKSKFTCPDMGIYYVNEGGNFINYTIYDTPGPDFAGAAHSESAFRAVENCDVAIFAIDYSKFLTNDEEKYLSEVKQIFESNKKFHTLIFDLNKIDLAFGDTGTKSRVKSIDFIRYKLAMVSPEYKDCIVFATSALDYFYSLELEKAAEKETALSPLRDKNANLYSILRSCKDELEAQGANDDLTAILSHLDGEVGKIKSQLGHSKVDMETLRTYSGIPQLIDYVNYVAESKARDEILNSITSTIGQQSKALQSIVNKISNYDEIMGQNRDKIETIRRIIADYAHEIKETLPEDGHGLSENDIDNIDSQAYVAGEVDVLLNKGRRFPLDIKDIIDDMQADLTQLNEKSIEKAIWDGFIERYENEYKYKVGKIIPKSEPEQMAQRILRETVNSYKDIQISGLVEDAKKDLKEFKEDLQKILIFRKNRIEEISERCKQRLDREDCKLKLPEMTTFEPSIPDEALNEKLFINIQMDYRVRKEGGSYKKINPVHQFFRNLGNFFTKGDFNYSPNEIKINGSLTSEDIRDLKISATDALDDSGAIDTIMKELQKVADMTKTAANEVLKYFKKMNSGNLEEANYFSKIIDNSEAFEKENADYELLKKLISDIDGASKDFMDIWKTIDI